MRMWGNSLESLLVASGTILNEVSFAGPELFLFQLHFMTSKA